MKASVMELILLPETVTKIRRWAQEEESVLNFQRHVITCKFIAFHSSGHFMETTRRATAKLSLLNDSCDYPK